MNILKEVGVIPAIIVIFIDIVKGAAVAAITHWALHLDKTYVLIGIVAAVIGHSWMIWLKFSGGKGMAVIVGSLLVIMPVYGYEKEMFIIIGLVTGLFLLTRNVALSLGIGLMVLPFLFWLGRTHSGLLVIWYVVIALIVFGIFLPTALRALAKSKNIRDFIMGR